MCVGPFKPKAPPAPAAPIAPPDPGKGVSEGVKASRAQERKRLGAIAGRSSTILTAGLAGQQAKTSKPTLLGT